jgi:hypothetical protein
MNVSPWRLAIYFIGFYALFDLARNPQPDFAHPLERLTEFIVVVVTAFACATFIRYVAPKLDLPWWLRSGE